MEEQIISTSLLEQYDIKNKDDLEIVLLCNSVVNINSLAPIFYLIHLNQIFGLHSLNLFLCNEAKRYIKNNNKFVKQLNKEFFKTKRLNND